MKRFRINSAMICILITAAFACKQGGDGHTTGSGSKSDHSAIQELIIPGIWESFLHKEIGYLPVSMNSAENIDNYYRPKNKIVNAGIFYADLVYSAVNGYLEYTESNASSVSVLIIGTIADTNLNIVIDRALLESLFNNDSLSFVIEGNGKKIFSELMEKDKVLGGLFLTGIWVEEAFLTSQALKGQDLRNDNVMQDLFAELDSLIEFLNSVPEDETLKSMLKALIRLQSIYPETDSDRQEGIKTVYSTIEIIRDSIVS